MTFWFFETFLLIATDLFLICEMLTNDDFLNVQTFFNIHVSYRFRKTFFTSNSTSFFVSFWTVSSYFFVNFHRCSDSWKSNDFFHFFSKSIWIKNWIEKYDHLLLLFFYTCSHQCFFEWFREIFIFYHWSNVIVVLRTISNFDVNELDE